MSYRHGDPAAICMRCGKKLHLSQLRKEWTGLLVCSQCFDPRHPQDFVRAVADVQKPRRQPSPEPADTFVDLIESENDLTASDWTATNVTTVADQAANASFVTLLDTMHDGTANAAHHLAQSISSTAGRTYRLAGTVKAKDHTWFQVGGGSAVWGTTFWANFRALGNGSVGNKGSGVTSASIIPTGNGCYRFAMTGVATTTASTDAMFLALTNNTDSASRLLSYAGTSSGIYLGELSYTRIMQASEL
jgi:hypothetical protein